METSDVRALLDKPAVAPGARSIVPPRILPVLAGPCRLDVAVVPILPADGRAPRLAFDKLPHGRTRCF
jgi:hypothetical protein